MSDHADEKFSEKAERPEMVEEGYNAGTKSTVINQTIANRVVKKLDRRLVPWVMLLYLLAYLDRSNIGNANTAGMSKDLGISDAQYQWLLTIFYISYIVFEWMALLWKIVPPHRYATAVVIGWGLCAMLQGVAKNWSGMMALRFFMGWAEAGYGPGVPYLLSFFYLRRELGLRIGFFLSAAPLASCFAGALAYAITHAKHSAVAPWRLLFIVEGAPTIIVGILTWFVLPDAPEKAKFLTEEEQHQAKLRAIRQVGEEAFHSRIGKPNFGDIGRAFLDPKNYFTALIYFSTNVSFASLPVFLPEIIKDMGFTSIDAQGLTAPPFFLSFLMVILTTWIADRTQQRGYMVMGLALVGAIGYLLLAVVKTTGVRYFGVVLAAGGVFPVIGNVLPWVLNNQPTDSRRGAGIAILNLIGQCGPVLGTRLFPKSEAPFYHKGMAICAAFMLFDFFLAAGLRIYCYYENKKLDAKYGPKPEFEGDAYAAGEENEGENFRNVL